MLLDKYNREYKSEDLHIEWMAKIKQFKILRADLVQFSDVFDSLIELTEYIAQSDFSRQLFPGTVMNELKISPVIHQRVIVNSVMRIYCTEDGYGPFAITLNNGGVEKQQFICPDGELIKPFLTSIHLLNEMKT